MTNFKTVRGQSARIVVGTDDLFSIELYANGAWQNPAGCYAQKFTTQKEAEEFFVENQKYICC